MRYFSYNDYEDYADDIKMKKSSSLKEKSSKYKIINEGDLRTVNNDACINAKNIIETKDEIVKKLMNKENVVKFLTEYFNFKIDVSNENLKMCLDAIKFDKMEDFPQKNFILYKLTNEGKYFYFEHIEKIDYNIPYKMFNISMNIIDYWVKQKKQDNKYPIVFPIIIYTGDEKWDLAKNQNKFKIRCTTYKKNGINLAYNIIDIKNNKYKFIK